MNVAYPFLLLYIHVAYIHTEEEMGTVATEKTTGNALHSHSFRFESRQKTPLLKKKAC